jgi:hypothetical protein
VSSLREAIDAAKARLPMPMLLAQLGLEPHAKRSARCPLHEDRHPSFSVFLGERGWRWKCHAGCGEGDEIGFLEAHLHITRADAVQRFCAMGGQTVTLWRPRRIGGVTSNTERPTSNIRWTESRAASGVGSRRSSLRPSCPSSSLGTHLSAKLQLRPDGKEAGASKTVCVPKLELGNEDGNTTTTHPRSGHPLHPSSFVTHPSPSGPRLPDDARILTNNECDELAALRRISPEAPWCACGFGTLFIGTVGGFRSWIVTDERRLCAEARRMDGQHFPAIGDLGERKAHTLRGSVKNWPVGLAALGFDPGTVRAWLAVEGGPDYLAAMHFIIAGSRDCLPMAFLGAGTARELHPEAFALLRGRRVRFYPHADASGAGQRAAQRWCGQLSALGCTCDAVDFATLPAIDGVPIKDLNDCTRLAAAHTEGLLP